MYQIISRLEFVDSKKSVDVFIIEHPTIEAAKAYLDRLFNDIEKVPGYSERYEKPNWLNNEHTCFSYVEAPHKGMQLRVSIQISPVEFEKLFINN